jgi:Tol biopolymer transport system component/DNA-binding winged helix-turn-helix (wHTH) protein
MPVQENESFEPSELPELPGHRYRFDDFLLDPASHTLRQGDRVVPITLKAFDTLLYLVRHAGRTVAKESLMRAVWNGASVEENNLNQAISAARKALGDVNTPRRYILTVSGRGYRFLPQVVSEPLLGAAAVLQRDGALASQVATESNATSSRARAQTLTQAEAEAEQPAQTQRSWSWPGLLLAAVSVCGGLIVTMWWGWGLGAIHPDVANARGATMPEPSRAVPITSEPGDEDWPSFSSDETRLAFSRGDAERDEAHIAVKNLATGAVTRLTTVEGGNDVAPVWSPDGRFIAFMRSVREPAPVTQICLVEASGGTPRVLHEQPAGAPAGLAWWNAGNALIFSARATSQGPFHLAALDIATQRVRALTTPLPAPHVSAPGDSQPAISQDGRLLAFVRETDDGMHLVVFDLLTMGPERRLLGESRRIEGVTWRPDGKSLIVAAPRVGTITALYRVAIDDGAFVRIANVDDIARRPVVIGGAGRAGRLAFSVEQLDTNIYRVDLRDGGSGASPRRIIGSSRLDDAPHISPDGTRIAFESSRSGIVEIWEAEADGANPRQVTFLKGRAGRPRWSPDGRLLAFAARARGEFRPDIWVIDARGGQPRRISADPAHDTTPIWSADGTAIYFMSDRSGQSEIWRAPLLGGPATRVTNGGGMRAQESPNGETLYFSTDTPEISSTDTPEISARPRETSARRVPTPTPTPTQVVFRFPPDAHWGGEWDITARGLYYLNDRAAAGATIDFLPFRSPGAIAVSRAGAGSASGSAWLGAGGRTPSHIASFTAQPSRGVSFSIAPDESWLVFSQEDYRNQDIMLLDTVP